MESIHTRWLIVGGGPAGAMAARELARAGEEALCLQRKLDFRKPCGGGLRTDAFETFGLSPTSILHRVDRIDLHHGESTVEIPLEETALAIVDRRRFDSDLRGQAADAGASIVEATFRSLRKNGEGFEVTASRQGNPLRIHCRHLIAADGVLSPLRRQLTASLPPSHLTHYLESAIPASDPHTAHFHFGSKIAGRGYAWDFPGAGGRHLGTLAGKKRLRNFLGDLSVENEGGKILGYRIPRYEKPLFHSQGVCFVGDAAGQVLPFTYEGIYYALASAKLMVTTLLEEGSPEAYAKAWRRRFGEKFDALHRLEQLFLTNDLSIALMMRLYRHPSVRRAMIRLWLQDDYPIPSGWQLTRKILRKAFSPVRHSGYN